jgi:hypothetical protein
VLSWRRDKNAYREDVFQEKKNKEENSFNIIFKDELKIKSIHPHTFLVTTEICNSKCKG